MGWTQQKGRAQQERSGGPNWLVYWYQLGVFFSHYHHNVRSGAIAKETTADKYCSQNINRHSLRPCGGPGEYAGMLWGCVRTVVEVTQGYWLYFWGTRGDVMGICTNSGKVTQ